MKKLFVLMLVVLIACAGCITAKRGPVSAEDYMKLAEETAGKTFMQYPEDTTPDATDVLLKSAAGAGTSRMTYANLFSDISLLADGSVTTEEFQYLGDVTGLIQAQIDLKAATDRKLDDFGTPDDNTDLDATTTYHGLLPKLNNVVTDFLNGQGGWSTPAGGGTVDTSGTPVTNDIARFTDADTIEGRSYAEFKADLDLEVDTDLQAYDADLDTLSSPTAWRVFYSNGSSVLTELVLGANGTYLRSTGASSAPTFTTPAGSGTMNTIKENDSPVGDADIVTLDFFGADFDLAETPDTEVQVIIAAAIARVAAIDMEMLNDVDNEGNVGWILKDNGDGTYSFTNSLTGLTFGGFTANRAMETDGSGNLEVSAVTDTELALLSGKTGLADTSGTPVANDIARFTDADTVEGRSYAEFKADLDLEAGTDFYSMSAADTAFEAELDNSAGLIAAINDETGNGQAVFSEAPLIVNMSAVGSITSEAGSVIFYEADDNGSNWVRVIAPASIGTNWAFTLPDEDGEANEFLQTNGSGVTSWSSDTKDIAWNVFDSDVAVSTGDGVAAYTVPASLNGMDLIDAVCSVYSQGVTGTTDVQVRRRRAGSDVDMLTVLITIAAEFFATDETIDTSNDDVNTGDQIYIDVDAIHSGTAPNGLSCVLEFETP